VNLTRSTAARSTATRVSHVGELAHQSTSAGTGAGA
jgi:hypothetical protein